MYAVVNSIIDNSIIIHFKGSKCAFEMKNIIIIIHFKESKEGKGLEILNQQ